MSTGSNDMDKFSDNEEEIQENNVNDYEDNIDDENLGPMIDWDEVLGSVNVDTCEDDISTVCFSINDSMDSAYQHQWAYEYDGQSNGTDHLSDSTSHVEAFCYEHRCQACGSMPNSGVAEVLCNNWALYGMAGTINGILYFGCTECRPTSFWHAECVEG